MTAKEAKDILLDRYPDKKIIETLEFDDFYAFALVDINHSNEDAFGGGYHTVYKSNGKISAFNPVDNLSLFMSAKNID